MQGAGLVEKSFEDYWKVSTKSNCLSRILDQEQRIQAPCSLQVTEWESSTESSAL